MNTLPEPAVSALTVVLALSTAVWVGGYVAIAVVARVATRTMDDAARVAFFRDLGRAYLITGGSALVLALISGGALLAGHPWDGWSTAVVALAAALILTTITGILQARRMTRLRSRALEQPELRERVRHDARRAGMLRGLIGALSLALLVLGVLQAT